MSGLERLALLLSVIERLCAVMAQENDCLRRMEVETVRALHLEKRRLAEAYERELGQLRREPTLLAELPVHARIELEEAMRRLHAAARRNSEVLWAAKTVSERLLRHLAESLAEHPFAHSLSSPRGATSGTGKVVAISCDQRI